MSFKKVLFQCFFATNMITKIINSAHFHIMIFNFKHVALCTKPLCNSMLKQTEQTVA